MGNIKRKTLREVMYDNPILMITLVVWCMGIISFATFAVFTDMANVTAAVASCFGALIGLPSVVLAFVQWRMGQDAKKDISANSSL